MVRRKKRRGPVGCTPRTPVRKAAEISAEGWLKAGLPKGHGLPSPRVMAGQMALLAERLLLVLRIQQERYARYVEEHPPALAPIHKDAAKDLPPEAINTYHTWLEGVALRREWWRDEAVRFELDQIELSDVLLEALEEAVGTGGEAARRALGALRAGFTPVGQVEAQGLLKELAAYASSNNLEAQAIYQAIADRAAGRALRAAVLRDGAGRVVGAVSYRTVGGVLSVGRLGALDGQVPGAGVQMVREIAAIAAQEGSGVTLTAPLEAQSFFSGLGFAPDAEGGLRLAAQAATTLAEGTGPLPGWVRVGWLEGPARTFSEVTGDVAGLEAELAESWEIATANFGQAQAALANFKNRAKDVALENMTADEAASMHLYTLRAKDGGLDAVALVRETAGKPLYGDRFGARPGRTGAGREMMRNLANLDSARENGFVLNSTESAEGFYARLGMTQTKARGGWTGAEYYFKPEEARAFASGLTGDTAFAGQISWELAVAGASDWLRAHKIPGVVDEVSKTTHKALVDALAYGLERGESTQQLAYRVRQLDNVFGPVRAERIARTEVITANRAGGYQMGKEAGCQEHEWRSRVESTRTRDWHRGAHKQRVPYDQPYTVYNRLGEPQQLMYPGDTSLGAGPDNVIQCFPGDVRVGAQGIERLYRRWYEGPLVEIETALGHELAGTPNHPVLSSRGWVALNRLNEGDYLICCRRGDERMVAGSPDIQDAPPSFEELHRALGLTGIAKRLRVTAEDFHGDGADGEIEVVCAAGELRDGMQSPGTEKSGQFTFPGSNHDSGQEVASRSCQHGSLLVSSAVLSPPDRRVSRLRQAQALFGRGLSHTGIHAVRSIARFNATLEQKTANHTAGHSELGRDGLLGRTTQVEGDHIGGDLLMLARKRAAMCIGVVPQENPDAFETLADCPWFEPELLTDGGAPETRLVEFARVVKIDRQQDFMGHVYNLQTAEGWYAANGIIAHNCRCSERHIKPGVTDDETLGIHEHGLADGPSAPGPVVAGTVVEEVQKHLPGQHDQKTHGHRYGPAADDELWEKERQRLRGLKAEQVVMRTASGKVLRGPIGTDVGAEWTPEMWAEVKGSTILHNHPRDYDLSFSPQDMLWVKDRDHAAMEVISPSGALFRVKPGPNGWPDFHTVQQAYLDATDEADATVDDSLPMEQWGPAQGAARRTVNDRAMRRLQEAGWIVYETTVHKDKGWVAGPNAGWRRKAEPETEGKLTKKNVDARIKQVLARWDKEDEAERKLKGPKGYFTDAEGQKRPVYEAPVHHNWWKEVEPESDGTLYPMAVSAEARGGYADAKGFAAPGQYKRVWMEPGEYLRVCDAMFSDQYAKPVTSQRILYDLEGLDELRERIRTGEPLSIPWLDYNADDHRLNGQEGRHRALAAMLEGVDVVPVDIVLRHGARWIDYPEALSHLRAKYGIVLQQEPANKLEKRVVAAFADLVIEAIIKDKGWMPGPNAGWRRRNEEPDGPSAGPTIPEGPERDAPATTGRSPLTAKINELMEDRSMVDPETAIKAGDIVTEEVNRRMEEFRPERERLNAAAAEAGREWRTALEEMTAHEEAGLHALGPNGEVPEILQQDAERCDALCAASQEANKALYDFDAAHYDRAKTTLEVLSEIRPMGGEPRIIAVGEPDAERLVSVIEEGAEVYPTAWMDRTRTTAPVQVYGDVGKDGRAFYDGHGGVHIGSGGASVARHELGHHFEETNAELSYVALNFYEQRTLNDDLVPLGRGYRADEFTRKDKFFNKYVGKDYRSGATEILSMGAQYLFGGYREQEEVWKKDPEYAKFIIGVLAAVR